MSPTILIPLAPDMNSVISLQSVEKFFSGINDGDGRPLQPYYVLNQFDTSLPAPSWMFGEVMRRQLGDRLLPFVIRRAPAVAEALAEGMTVVDYAPDAPVSSDYLNLATWLAHRRQHRQRLASATSAGVSDDCTAALPVLILIGGISLLGFTGIIELTWPQQIVLGILTVALAVWLDRSSSSYLVTLTLLLVSMFSTFRYGFWRMSTTIDFFRNPGSIWTLLDAFFICLLLIAESYAFIILFLGYLQTIWPLRRTPVPLPDDPATWPSVDLLIPTYNEPLSVVKYTALAAMNIDWPADKLNVYILDDGKREEFRQFAKRPASAI